MSQSKQSMRAAAIDEFGGEIRPHFLPLPDVGDDEILIQVQSAGIGRWDPYEQRGEFASLSDTAPKFPYVLGSDGAGTVASVGERVHDFQPGDRVYAFGFMNPKGGFYAQYAAVKATNVSRIPGRLTVEQAGALAVDGITALIGLQQVLKIQPGEAVMILGASGGVGHLALQLAKRMGARVIAVASGEDGRALARKLGADAVVDGHAENIVEAAYHFAPDGLDAALLTAGGKPAEQAVQAVRAGGRMAYPNGVQPEPPERVDIQTQAYDGIPTPELIRKLNALIDMGPFEVHVSRFFPLDQAAEAHQALNQHFLGKLALRPN